MYSQELELFNPKLLNKTQVVAINKIDDPDARELLDDVIKEIKMRAKHTRIIGISAATNENVAELMIRVRQLVEALPAQSEFELFMQEETRVSFDENEDDSFEILTDPNFPGQFRVVGKKIEKIVETTKWDYYEAVQRFQRILVKAIYSFICLVLDTKHLISSFDISIFRYLGSPRN
jgi:GTPase